MAANGPGQGLFGVRGFGLYERFTAWVGEPQDEERPSRHMDAGSGFLAGPLGHSSAVRVMARCRPLLRSGDASCSLSADESPEGARLRLEAPQVGMHEACCSGYLGPLVSQEMVFEHAAHMVTRTVDGCNGLVLCCGASHSGKTYTMAGSQGSNSRSGANEASEGLIPRAARLVFEKMEKMEEVFVVEVSFLDVHAGAPGEAEKLTDLLAEKSAGGRLRVLQDALRPGAFVCEGLSRAPARRHEKVGELLKTGLKRRELLEASSKRRAGNAHCIFTIGLESLTVGEDSPEPIVKRGKLVFVEFAGLPSPGLVRGVPEPSAALELLLSDCVRGDSPVLLIANFSPELKCAEESVRTLALAEIVHLGIRGSEDPPPDPEPDPISELPSAAEPEPPAQAWTAAAVPTPAASSVPALASRGTSTPARRAVAPTLARRAPSLGRREVATDRPGISTAWQTTSPRELAQQKPLSPEKPITLQASSRGSAEFQFRSKVSSARVAELEEQLKESAACRRAIEMEAAQLKVRLASTEERVRLLGEHADELAKDRSGQDDEQRTMRRKTDMQQQKLMMFEDQLHKLQAEVMTKKAEVASAGAMLESDLVSQEQERESWRTQEAELRQQAAKLRREVEDFKRKSSMERFRADKTSGEACMQLRLQIQQLEEKAVAENTALEQAWRQQSTMETERRIQEQREEALKEESIRKMLSKKQELEEAKARSAELEVMLSELQEGLLSVEQGPDEQPMTLAGA